jgi:hypothetical protein
VALDAVLPFAAFDIGLGRIENATMFEHIKGVLKLQAFIT